jgi:hypothetical protein
MKIEFIQMGITTEYRKYILIETEKRNISHFISSDKLDILNNIVFNCKKHLKHIEYAQRTILSI